MTDTPGSPQSNSGDFAINILSFCYELDNKFFGVVRSGSEHASLRHPTNVDD